MRVKKVIRAWLTGWRDLLYYGSIAGYQELRWLARKRLDHAALWVLCRSRGFRCAVLLLIVVQLLVLSFAWHWDLDGWRRDILRALPALLVLPLLATARKGAIGSLLRHAD